jgi:hypothetical protein
MQEGHNYSTRAHSINFTTPRSTWQTVSFAGPLLFLLFACPPPSLFIPRAIFMTPHIQRSSLAASPALDAFVYALKSGTPLARERAAALVVEFSQDETARRRFEELHVQALLQRVTEIGNANAKKHANTAIRKLQHPIEPTAATSPSPAARELTPQNHHEPLSFKPAEDWLKGLTNDNKQGPKKKNSFVNNYRLRAPSRASHI